MGAFVDETSTTAVKARFIGSKAVDGTSTGVETLKGTVLLSGFAKNTSERKMAKTLAWKVAGVKQVKNEIAVRP